ncbi:hypothetical protein DYB38_012396, partial [Aphanomyces astaci]
PSMGSAADVLRRWSPILAPFFTVTTLIICIAITKTKDIYVGSLAWPYFSDMGRGKRIQVVFASLFLIAFILYIPVGLAIVCPFERLTVVKCLTEGLGTDYCATTIRFDATDTKLYDYSNCGAINQLRSAAQLVCILTLVGYALSFATHKDDDAVPALLSAPSPTNQPPTHPDDVWVARSSIRSPLPSPKHMARTSAISEEVWANAIRAVLVDKMSLRNAAQKFGVHHMSLHRRIKDLRGDKKPEKRDVGSRTPVAAAPTTPFMQPGMSMVNMMQMNMAQGLDTTKLPPPPTRLSSSSTYPVRASPLLQFRHHPYEGTSSPSTGRFPGIENASANMSAWFKAVQAVEMGHLDVHQAAATFHLDPNALHDHLSRQAPTSGREVPAEMFLTQIETHGVLKVVVARAEVGVKMDYDELADLVRRVLFVRPGPTSAGWFV